jgi:hypothetical protein
MISSRTLQNRGDNMSRKISNFDSIQDNTTTRVKNRNSNIRVSEDNNGELRTETRNRDEGSACFAITTNAGSKASSLYIDLPNTSVRLSGSEARTLYRLLNKHYTFTGKSV